MELDRRGVLLADGDVWHNASFRVVCPPVDADVNRGGFRFNGGALADSTGPSKENAALLVTAARPRVGTSTPRPLPVNGREQTQLP